MQKVKVILDTDVANEVDDQFAICYLMKSLENIDLQAITIAPFFGSGYSPVKTIEEGINLSFDTASKVLDLIDKSEYKFKMYKGATKYFFESKLSNPAVDKIIEIAKANDKTTILAIGAITNVALALYLAPEIAEKIDIVWLGGNSLEYGDNKEFNFRQDVQAVDFVYKSKVNLAIIPCRNVAINLVTTIYELEHYLGNIGEIGKYLCSVFRDCKKAYRKQPQDIIGESKTLWDLSAIAYILNKDWFKTREISCPDIMEDGTYKTTNDKRKITYVYDLNRHKILQDFFIKMGCKI